MNAFSYKGYEAVVELDHDSRGFVGKVSGISDLVTFTADSYDGLKAAFEESVDDYLSFCSEIGVAPDKAFKGLFQVRVEPSRHRALAMRAMRERISLNAVVSKAIDCFLDAAPQVQNNSFTVILDSAVSAKATPDFKWEGQARAWVNAGHIGVAH